MRGRPVKSERANPALVYVDRRNAAVLAGSTLAEIDYLAGVQRLRPSLTAEGVDGDRSVVLLYRLNDVLTAVAAEKESDMRRDAVDEQTEKAS